MSIVRRSQAILKRDSAKSVLLLCAPNYQYLGDKRRNIKCLLQGVSKHMQPIFTLITILFQLKTYTNYIFLKT